MHLGGVAAGACSKLGVCCVHPERRLQPARGKACAQNMVRPSHQRMSQRANQFLAGQPSAQFFALGSGSVWPNSACFHCHVKCCYLFDAPAETAGLGGTAVYTGYTAEFMSFLAILCRQGHAEEVYDIFVPELRTKRTVTAAPAAAVARQVPATQPVPAAPVAAPLAGKARVAPLPAEAELAGTAGEGLAPSTPAGLPAAAAAAAAPHPAGTAGASSGGQASVLTAMPAEQGGPGVEELEPATSGEGAGLLLPPATPGPMLRHQLPLQ